MPVAVAVTTRLWLLGHGIAHSPSPAMQNAALRACGLRDWEYAIRDVPAEDLDDVVAEVRAGAAVGCNVTIPHKRAVAAACDGLDGDAELTHAVNTVVRGADGSLVGHNTDVEGLRRGLDHAGLLPADGSAVVVLGAGGAARAVVLALTRCAAGVITVAARRPDAAAEVVAGMGRWAPALRVAGWDSASVAAALRRSGSALLVNATPAPLAALPVDVAALPETCAVVDLRYRYGAADLVPAARARGLRAADGREMLLQQGMLSFTLWTGVDPPPYDAARAALHDAVAAA